MPDSTSVRLEKDGRVATIILDRPQQRNALSLEALRAIRATASKVAADDAVWVVVLTGAGDRAFSAGADLKERRGMDDAQVKECVREIRAAASDIAALPQPTVAILNGHAFGGGLEMALACDLRVMDEEAQVGLPETSLAIIPGAGGCVRLPRLVGVARAKELILLARRLGAEEALRIGLVNFVAPHGTAAETGSEVVAALLQNGPLALRAAKAAVDGGLGMALEEAMEHELSCYFRILPTLDRQEALVAFAEKRSPEFKGE